MTILNEVTKVFLLLVAWMVTGYIVCIATRILIIFTRVPFEEIPEFVMYWHDSVVPEEMRTGNPISKIDDAVTRMILWPVTLTNTIITLEKCLKDWK